VYVLLRQQIYRGKRGNENGCTGEGQSFAQNSVISYADKMNRTFDLHFMQSVFAELL
jgi:hypothetical protein